MSAFAVALLPATASASGNYSIVDIALYGSSGLGDCNYPLGRARINADGLVAGTWQDPTDYIDRAFVYDTTLTTLGYGTGGGINTNGVTTGYLYFDPDEGLTPPGAFRYSDETITNLGFPAPEAEYPFSAGKDINDSGTIAADASPTDYPPTHAFKWDGTWHDLGTLPDDTYSEARAINNSGTVVGWSGPNWAPAGHAFRYSGSSMASIPGIGGSWSEADDINDSGTVVGCAYTADGDQHAFVYDGTSTQDLTPSASNAQALAINSYGNVVGNTDGVAFVAIRGDLTDLNTQIDPSSGWVLTQAHDINDSGQIVGVGTHSGATRVFRLTPTKPIALALPTIAGTPEYGSSLTASTGHWGGPSLTYSYQWLRCSLAGTECSDVDGATTSTYTVGSGDLGASVRVRVTAESQYGSESAQSDTVQVAHALLAEFAPELRYDSQESYAADSAAEMTDNYVAGTYSNYLKDSDDSILASSDPAEPGPTLSLDHLGSYISNSTHVLDEHNDTYVDDANRLHALSAYGNKMYGRIVTDGPFVWLQYWFFYYYNPKTFFGAGAHEGDWEMIEIPIDGYGQPVAASYSQHEGGETCLWDSVEKNSDGRPVVYVAEGSHSNYFTAGTFDLWRDLDVVHDYANGEGPNVTPSVIDVTTAPAWITWPGTWGASGRSPSSLTDHEAWGHPLDWNVEAGGCRQSESFRVHSNSRTRDRSVTASAPPPTPVIRARINTARRVLINYAFNNYPSGARRPWTLLTTVVPSGRRYFPYTLRTRITNRRGTIVQKLGSGPGPYKLLVSALTKAGARSRIVSLSLK